MIPSIKENSLIASSYMTFLSQLAGSEFSGQIDTNYASRLSVATDNSVYQTLPQAVVFPKTNNDVQLLARLASQDGYENIQFTPRGGGTGTNGQSLTHGIVVDLSRHMDQLIELNVAERWVRVQTGMVKDALNDLLREHGLFFSPELSTSNRATIGGMINTDASGQGSLQYGKTSDHVLSVTAVLVNGESVVTTPVPADYKGTGSAEPKIYDALRHSCMTLRDEVERKFPKLNRFLTGYDLKHCYDPEQNTLDLTRVLCGSEGSLAVITEAKLNLTPIPKRRTLVSIKYDTFLSALRHAPELVKYRALSVETVDSKVLNLAKQDVVWHSVSELLLDVPGKVMDGINIVEFAGHDEAEQEALVKSLREHLDGLSNGDKGVIGYQICDDLVGINRIYAMRKKAVGLLGNAKGHAKPVAFTEDTCVPPENLADYIVEFRALLDAKGLTYGMFGHVDTGVLHVRPALDLCDPEQERLMREISDQVVALTAKYGGLMWGEHGRGYRSEYGPAFFGETLFNELRRIKGAFDPHNQINPGKICTPLGSEAALVSVDAPKRGGMDRQIPLHVRESFAAAVDCNGNGLCFNYDTSSPMCPSMKVSADRRFSPKGRAGLVREWLRQLNLLQVDPVMAEKNALNRFLGAPDLWLHKVKNTLAKRRGDYDFSHEVMEAMETCLACKACATACPVKVDVPSFRARFMFLYHGRYLRPLKDYFVGYVEQYAPLMAKAPRLFNAAMSPDFVARLTAKIIGMVDIPMLSYPTLKSRLPDSVTKAYDLKRLDALSVDEKARTVLVIQDPFTSYYEADVVADFVKLIEKLGLTAVMVPFSPNGKPQHIKGFLKTFGKTAHRTGTFLNRLHELDIAMVGVDPAMVLCYRDEYNEALGHKRGDFEVLLVQEYLVRVLGQVEPRLCQAQPYYLLGHCTEKALQPQAEALWAKIFNYFGIELTAKAVGCCGMAGTYGHDAKQVETSKAIYELSWRQTLESLPAGQSLTTGYSCRSQVKRMEGEAIKHPLQALLTELEKLA
jgi:FAD/FMN-containing dehydrogenase/Fe-S oxidoreductase